MGDRGFGWSQVVDACLGDVPDFFQFLRRETSGRSYWSRIENGKTADRMRVPDRVNRPYLQSVFVVWDSTWFLVLKFEQV